MAALDIPSKVIKALEFNGFRITKNRKKILESISSFNRPASADDIRIKAKLNPSDIVTVYRNLEAFESVGAIQRIKLENGTDIFELTNIGEHYHHLLCRKCLKVERLDICISKQAKEIAKSKGYTDIEHVLEVYGLCKNCSN